MSFDVRGFRSLVAIADVPVGSPTILAGHNDGGKTAVIDALRYLLGDYSLEDDDRSYLHGSEDQAGTRHPLTEVQGRFVLDEWEQQQFKRPAVVQIRRRSLLGEPTTVEILTDVHEDEALHDLGGLLLPALQEIAQRHGLPTKGVLKPKLIVTLEEFARTNATQTKWVRASRPLTDRLPEVLKFGGVAETPEAEVKTALMGRFHGYFKDPEMQGRLRELEHDIQDRLRADADDLCQHITARCADLGNVTVDPQVTLKEGFSRAELRVERKSGRPVRLDRSGLGSGRRIALAVWEWTSQLLKQNEADARAQELEPRTAETELDGASSVDEPPLRQTIVIYDEPDTHLDYRHQRKVMEIIRDQSALAHVNVVVATHSMNLIDGVDIGDVINLKLEDEQTVVELLGKDAHEQIDLHLGAIAASLGLRNSVLLHERVFLAVEGDSEYQAFPLLFRLAEGQSLQSAGIALWACGGNDGALRLAKYLFSRGRRVVLAVDDDSKTKAMFRDGSLSDVFGPNWRNEVQFIGAAEKCSELEASLTDEVWARVANSLWPRDDENKWEESHFAALRGEGKKFSKKVDELLSQQVEGFQSGKASTMAELAGALTDPADVPQSLQTLFTELIAKANED